ncbi:MAG: helix-turn-helix transcriptional regulator [Candidatus Omnitrophica bacterium]|nr:helix-turn-helix transcriptional regulator [Candidatus Omnitrophota bacterium]
MVVNLSSKLRTMRKQKGLTQLELAKKIGVSESYICQIENGKMISIKKLDKLAKALGCEAKDLL